MTDSFPNPLTLITRHALAGHHVDEILICTFNQNLAFFERNALAACRSTGARVTIIGDAAVAEHDVVAIRHAGISYLSGLVKASRTFHPKLIVLAGEDRALVAIGSGNLTIAGWWGNDELWSVHHA